MSPRFYDMRVRERRERLNHVEISMGIEDALDRVELLEDVAESKFMFEVPASFTDLSIFNL